MPKVVKGTILAVVIYCLFYLVATLFPTIVWEIPGSIIYLLLMYAIIGCFGMVVVLPLVILKTRK
ncbi:hypothetical protein [Halalkalibacter nanhaiisediminis]|uniref:Uncharacterized protein n=1 Tax=Halalkalibacter nanhaiisediminis TaxID=688079 RepID=A0A562QUU6_9BACI|nr:hypothetical protein [Halalkalibacter nanhaiisediminis]TWI59906.1 hypothetical protein IQ10_00329 [Halalkalibacter nanhaiisediminis]